MSERLGFGPFAFDRASQTLWRGKTLVPVGSRGAALLDALLASKGAVVGKAQLMDRAWPGTIVEESNLVVQIATLRKVLGRRPDGEEWIATVPRVGYQLVRSDGEAATTRPPSIAVLPFVNLGDGAAKDYFADGLVEDIIIGLSRFKTFAVLARTSSFLFDGRAVDVREVARELGARYVLAGSIRLRAGRIRVGAQLADGATGADIWADSFDAPSSDAFDLYDRLAETVVNMLEPRIRQAELSRTRRKPAGSLDAYDLFLCGQHHFQGLRTVQMADYDKAIEFLGRSIELDPDFAPALALRAWAHEKRLNRNGGMPGVDDAREAVAFAERALAADGSDPLAILVAGVVAMTIKGDLNTGYALIGEAFMLNPHSAPIAATAAYAYFHRGDYDAAIDCHKRTIAARPGLQTNVWPTGNIARAHLAAGRIEEALTWAMRTREYALSHDLFRAIEVAAYALLGRHNEAGVVRTELETQWPGSTVARLLDGDPRARRHEALLAEGLERAGVPRG